ncbi:MAG: hypothetical protein EXR49_07745 [Dehalococcoidia bacterium]|nr:hypothetical protein [Dehalococcoidia bacterium]
MATPMRGKAPLDERQRLVRVHSDVLRKARGADRERDEGAARGEGRLGATAAMARGMARDIAQVAPQPLGWRRRVTGTVSRMASLLVMRLPMPAEVKWQYTLDFIGDLTIEYYLDLAKSMPEAEARLLVVRTLSASGRRWMRDMTRKQGVTLGTTLALADVLKLVFRTLNIDTSVEVLRDEVVVTNHACPYLAKATEQRMASSRMCEMICGDVTSLMDGMSQGLPAPVRYRSQTMMGQGDRVCTKYFSVTRPAGG